MSYEDDTGGFSMMDLFRVEVETQIGRLSQDLIRLEREGQNPAILESLMRASHSTKGAARMVGVLPAEKLAHLMEDYFVAAQASRVEVNAPAIDTVLSAADLLMAMSRAEHLDQWEQDNTKALASIQERLSALMTPAAAPARTSPVSKPPVLPAPGPPVAPVAEVKSETRTMRLAADRLDALLNLSGEAQVLGMWLTEFSQSLLDYKTRHAQLHSCLLQLESKTLPANARVQLEQALQLCGDGGRILLERLEALNEHDRRVQSVTKQLFEEVLLTRMRPFSDAVQNLNRMVRDLSRDLGKEAELQLQGLEVLVDRDILERLESPLTQLLRNALDHGIESALERSGQGKPEHGSLLVQARHSRGWLFISVVDDGRGLNYSALRERLVERNLCPPEVAERLSQEELIEFIFLPGFSSRTEVTEISGRGVGLDLVRQTLGEVGGRVVCRPASPYGLEFEIRLPIALSILQCLMVEIAGQIYGFPLARLDRALQVEHERVTSVEGRPWLEEENMALVMGHNLLGLPPTDQRGSTLSIVGLRHNEQNFGMVVDRFLGKEKLVTQRLDSRLGKLQHVTVGAILKDGTPTLVLDVDDLVRSMSRTLEDWRQEYFPRATVGEEERKRVLVVDDSITVREVERNLLRGLGYDVDVAVDGMDGWNAVRSGRYSLVVSDIDMPRMDGFELVRQIRADPLLSTLPIIIVSYKDREEDKMRGLEIGADAYLTKASFHDDKFAQTVRDLIG